jgi:hypothetical protein
LAYVIIGQGSGVDPAYGLIKNANIAADAAIAGTKLESGWQKNAANGILALRSLGECKFWRDRISRTIYKDNLGTTIFHANDTLRNTISTTPVKIKETKLNAVPDSSLRIYFQLHSSI